MRISRKDFPRKKYRWHQGFSKLYFAQGPGYTVGVGPTAAEAALGLNQAYRELKGKLR